MRDNENISRFKAKDCSVNDMRQHYANTLKPVIIDPLDRTGKISVEDLHISMGAFDVWGGSCASGMSVTFTDPPNLYALYLPLAGAMEVRQGSKTVTSTPGGILTCDLSKTNNILIHENRSHIGIAFRKDVLRRQLSELTETPVDRNFDIFGEISADRDGYLATMCLLAWNSLARDPERGIAARSNEVLLTAIMVRLLETASHRYSSLMHHRQSPAMPRHVKIAIDFMVQHPLEPLSLDEIAAAAGVSSRALQLGFKHFKNTTPLAYFRRLRLDGARLELRSRKGEKINISDLAKHWGFSNVARFSEQYLMAFGESPKQTLGGHLTIK